MLKKILLAAGLAWFYFSLKNKEDATFLVIVFGVIYLVYFLARKAWRSGDDEARANRYLADLAREKERNGR